MKKFITYTLFAVIVLTSCSKFLDEKPDKKMAVPKTLEHANLLLNDYTTLNTVYPTFGEIAADDYFVSTDSWNALSDQDEKEVYLWSDQSIIGITQWQNPYKAIYQANQVLEILNKMEDISDPVKFRQLESEACFFRAFALHQLAVVFAPPFRSMTATQDLGLPIRLSPDLDYPSSRSTLFETYHQIIQDYKNAITGLRNTKPPLGRPSKAAAYAGIARTYLDIADYSNAFKYADSALQLNNFLINFNDVPASSAMPFARFNDEVLFPASTFLAGPLGTFFSRVDSNLYLSYGSQDLRKERFYQKSEDGHYSFKGSYDGSESGIFVGITTSEIYLIRAEAAVRTNNIQHGLSDLNHLLKNRWATGTFSEITESDPERLLKIVLNERRKELVFRGRRWADLKRLNQEARFEKTLVRRIADKKYTLLPNSNPYAILIPKIVIDLTGIPQNIR
ncbi:RagB/SusD family nutrient uptake outer membrane protein [Sphingobacterium faecium]|uniref:RagB/SusD family nutrient uptake outer membrane protein n=1 Tax=Sphingobacterium faecium TaxID=34087 RepID=UPI0018854A59|nr:RagB/SusD family nutrient uptake outer membrane protein [Sphingobacterium faecium]